jgi:hypothetical protein
MIYRPDVIFGKDSLSVNFSSVDEGLKRRSISNQYRQLPKRTLSDSTRERLLKSLERRQSDGYDRWTNLTTRRAKNFRIEFNTMKRVLITGASQKVLPSGQRDIYEP